MRKLEWIESGGGPLLLAPRSRIRDWCGIEARASESQADYDRACAIEDEVGIISIGDRSAVVLGDEPDRTALVSQPAEMDRYLSVSLQSGGYSIETAAFEPNRETGAVVHRMKLHLKTV